jgi:hypothetical protein
MVRRSRKRAIVGPSVVVATRLRGFCAAGRDAGLSCDRLELPLSSTYAAGAAILMATLADQTSLPWPDEFPRKIERAEKPEAS